MLVVTVSSLQSHVRMQLGRLLGVLKLRRTRCSVMRPMMVPYKMTSATSEAMLGTVYIIDVPANINIARLLRLSNIWRCKTKTVKTAQAWL
jgi:hypothetical protein